MQTPHCPGKIKHYKKLSFNAYIIKGILYNNEGKYKDL